MDGDRGAGLLLFLHGSPARRAAGFALPGFEVTASLDTGGAHLATLSCGEVPKIVDEGFGRTLTLLDPDRYAWTLTKHDPELYT